MGKYAVTINFFLPVEIVENLKKIQVLGDFLFDRRFSSLCHCTVKSIFLGDTIPLESTLNNRISSSERIISQHCSFSGEIKNVMKFPFHIVAKVYSDELISLHKKMYFLPSSIPQYEGENYVPHVSIIKSIQENAFLSQENCFGKFEVRELQLMVWDKSYPENSFCFHRFHLSRT